MRYFLFSKLHELYNLNDHPNVNTKGMSTNLGEFLTSNRMIMSSNDQFLVIILLNIQLTGVFMHVLNKHQTKIGLKSC